MSELNFIETNAGEILAAILKSLENDVAEPLYPGDERRIYGEALSNVVVTVYNTVNDACRQKLLRYARAEVLDAIGESRGVPRMQPSAAKTTLRFTLNEAVGVNVTIPAGTRATGDFVRYFATDRTAVLTVGGAYIDVPATADSGGGTYNGIPAGGVNTLVDLVPYIDGVSNIDVTYGGSDREEDEPYRERIRNAPNKTTTAGSIASYKYWALAADSTIADVAVDSPSACEVVITVLLHGGGIPDEGVLQKVLTSVNADDVRPLTDHVTAKAPNVTEYDIDLTYYTTLADEADCIKAIEGSGGAIDQYIAWQDTALDRDINPDYLRKLILSPEGVVDGLPGASRVTLTAPTYTALGKADVAKFSGKLTVKHEIREG